MRRCHALRDALRERAATHLDGCNVAGAPTVTSSDTKEGRKMALLGKKSEEEKAAEAARQEQQRQDAEERKRVEAIERAKNDFLDAPAGRARLAYDHGDQIFQYSFDVVNHKAIVVAMVGSRQAQKTNDPVTILNSVCHEKAGTSSTGRSFSSRRDRKAATSSCPRVRTSRSRALRSATTCSGVRTRTSMRPRIRGSSNRPPSGSSALNESAWWRSS